MSDKNNTAKPNHKHTPGDQVAAEVRESKRPKYQGYRDYFRKTDNKPYLLDQDEILCAIMFDKEGHRLMERLTPAAFSYRGYGDFHNEKGRLELLADIAFTYWEKHGEPPAPAKPNNVVFVGRFFHNGRTTPHWIGGE